MRRSIQFILLPLIILAAACGDEKVVPLKGTLHVFVKLIDENGAEINDRSNVKITVGDDVVAYTDATGMAEFKDLPVGTYDLQAEKEGFDIWKVFSVQFAGGNVPGVVSDVRLIQYPAVQIQTVDIQTLSQYRAVYITGTISEANYTYFIYYVSTDPLVSNTNYQFRTSTSVCCGNITGFSQVIYFSDPGNHFFPGDKIYIAIYAKGNANNGNVTIAYYDYDFDQYVYPGEKRLTIKPLEVIVP